MQRREFLSLLAATPVSTSVQSKLARSIDDLEAAVRIAYGDVQFMVYEEESELMPLLIKVLRA
ncbi:hypothetical protein H4S14_003636 [Agrobacterium vitis]|nr:hypothetical protein [Agrobacterium vitis]MBE1439868.1 hypothetical protein [Agrobacterium vitis]